MRRLLLAVSLGIISASCLDPAGENFVELAHPAPGSITLDLADVSDDTIYIDRHTTFHYVINGFPIHVREVSAWLNKQPLSAQFGIEIYPRSFQSGFYTLKIRITGRSNTGSLADVLDEEQVDVDAEFPVVIDSDPSPPIDIVKLDTTQGSMTLTWNKCVKKNFIRYEIIKQFAGSSNQVASFSGINDTTWTDSNYMGGEVTYRVNVTTHQQITVGNERKYLWDPNFSVEIVNGYATVRWRKTPFYKNTKTCIAYSNSVMHTDLGLTDTVLKISDRVSFGAAAFFNVDFVSPGGRIQTFSTQYYVGTRHYEPTVIPRLYHSKENLYYGYNVFNGGSTVVMDENLSVIHTDNGILTAAISENGDYFISMKDNDFYFTDPRTLQATLALETGDTYVGSFVVGNNGLIGFHSSAGYRVVDINTGAQKFATGSATSSGSKLSPSGAFLVSNNKKLYRYNGASFDLVGTIPAQVGPFVFGNQNNIIGAIAQYESSMMVEYDVNTLSEISRVDLGKGPFSDYVGVDAITGKVVFERSSWKYLWEPGTDKVFIITPNFMTFLNGRLFAVDNFIVYAIDHNYLQ